MKLNCLFKLVGIVYNVIHITRGSKLSRHAWESHFLCAKVSFPFCRDLGCQQGRTLTESNSSKVDITFLQYYGRIGYTSEMGCPAKIKFYLTLPYLTLPYLTLPYLTILTTLQVSQFLTTLPITEAYYGIPDWLIFNLL